MFPESKVTEIYCMADDFCKEFTLQQEKYMIKDMILTVADGNTVFCDASGDSDNINLLERIVSDEVTGNLSGKAYKRNTVIVGSCKTCNKVGSSGTAGNETYANLSGSSGIGICFVYKGLLVTRQDDNSVAVAMKEWAVENGATHYTHWFQPMTGFTAEKHDSFITPVGDGEVIMDFSGKELVKGEPDASSFPSGGLRATFEARGYTAWDPTSPAFIKDGTLYIPTAFCSYSGEALDKKTPLLRSMETLNTEAVKMLKLLGNETVTSISTTIGPEQEYFLVDKDLYKKRKDLVFCGRTLFGAPAPKGQEMEDHYFGSLKPKVAAYMHDLDVELWKLGIPAKTKHNEVAPAQHELAPIFDTANVAVDHNQLTMEIMKKVADKHGLVCLLHEKPFEGINGSGKHNNWSLITNDGVNLLNPGSTPAQNIQFLVFLMAVIKAVDEYADLMRVSATSAGNDHRLGGNEAPPAIVSIFLGDELTAVLESIENDTFFGKQKKVQLDIGAHVLPHFVKDTTDRNRTSPFAFTGNKFEFRMLGSAASVANPNVVLNTAVAEALAQFYTELEGTKPEDMEQAVHELIKRAIRKHKKVIFNGNGYTDEWVAEAEKRGLYNLPSTPDCLPQLLADKNVELFTKHHVFTKEELTSRYEIKLENYVKTIGIEARTLAEMITKDFLPAVSTYAAEVSKNATAKKSFMAAADTASEEALVEKLSTAYTALTAEVTELKTLIDTSFALEDTQKCAEAFHDQVLAKMEDIRTVASDIEALIPDSILSYPTYDQLLFSL